MSLDATSTRPETLQSSLDGRLVVGRGFCWSSREGTLIPGTVANLTVRDKISKAQGVVLCLSRLHSLCCSFITQGGSVFMLRGKGSKWHQSASLSLKRGLCACFSQGSTENSEQFPLCLSQPPPRSVSSCYLPLNCAPALSSGTEQNLLGFIPTTHSDFQNSRL